MSLRIYIMPHKINRTTVSISFSAFKPLPVMFEIARVMKNET